MPPVVPFLQSGELKAIAVASKIRALQFPNIPAMAETARFEESDFVNWFGVFERSGTSTAILDELYTACAEALQDAQVRDVLTTQVAEPVGNTPVEYREFIQTEAAKYLAIIKLTGVSVK
jgi:tripartite-type tricarboxylate transporter receptor subunit TctC